VDSHNGWAAGGEFNFPSGNDRIIVHTSNAGASWNTQHFGSDEPSLHGIFFTDALSGFAVGEGSTVLATTNGGSTWVEQDPGVTGHHFEAVYFTSPDTGFIAGQNGLILYTTDAGTNWAQITSGTTDWLGGVWFSDSQTGWTVGGSNDTSTILATLDGGATWNSQSASTDTLLRDVHFCDSFHGWAVGAYGMIVHTTTGGQTGIEGGQIPEQDLLLRNWPDPFSGFTTIGFHLQHTGPVQLQVYDLLGRLVSTPLNGILQPGSHAVRFDADGMPPGVYSCRLTTSAGSATERLVLLK
jgi:hypothetical protein